MWFYLYDCVYASWYIRDAAKATDRAQCVIDTWSITQRLYGTTDNVNTVLLALLQFVLGASFLFGWAFICRPFFQHMLSIQACLLCLQILPTCLMICPRRNNADINKWNVRWTSSQHDALTSSFRNSREICLYASITWRDIVAGRQLSWIATVMMHMYSYRDTGAHPKRCCRTALLCSALYAPQPWFSHQRQLALCWRHCV